jgi:DDRGK domain-containing protein 1
MDDYNLILLAIALLGLSVMFGGMYFFMFKSDKEKTGRVNNNNNDNNNQRNGSSDGNNNNRDGLRRRNNRGNNDDEEENLLEGLDPSSKKYKKIAAKLEKKAARAARQEQERQTHEDKRNKMSKRDIEYQKKEEEREAKEKEEEEERRKLRAEEEQKEQEEYNQWKDMFETADAGSGETEEGTDSYNIFIKFLKYIRAKKVVVLEDLASEFQMGAQETIDRVKCLVKLGRLTGVIDDRGKFIYITTQEMINVADYMKNRGRVSMMELAKQSNKLIDLEEVELKVDDEDEANNESSEKKESDATE